MSWAQRLKRVFAIDVETCRQCGGKLRLIAQSDRCVLFNTTRAIVQGRAGVGLRRDATAFPGERGRFTRLNDERSGRLREMAASIGRRQPGFNRFQLASTIAVLT